MITFVNRFAFKEMLNSKNAESSNPLISTKLAYVSISDTEHEKEEVELLFSETDIDKELYITTQFPDNDDGIPSDEAQRLVDFIKKHPDKDFIVHCFMGISRSGAVAKFINEYYDMNDVILNTYTGYNRQVYNSLNAVIGKDIASYYAELEKADKGCWSE
jgi:protein tyrosine/serine phosphatase